MLEPSDQVRVTDAGEPADVSGDQVSLVYSSADHVLGDPELGSGLHIVVRDLLTHECNLQSFTKAVQSLRRSSPRPYPGSNRRPASVTGPPATQNFIGPLSTGGQFERLLDLNLR